MLEIPFTSDYDQRFITQLSDGKKYRFDARWNERGQTHTFDLTRDEDGELLLCGAPMLIGQDLLAPYALGIGGLILTDLSKKDTDAGPEDLGSRVIACHLSIDELAAIKAALGPQGASIVVSGAVPPVSGGGGGSSGGSGGGSGGTGGGTTIINTTSVINTFNVQGGPGFAEDIDLDDDTGNEVLIYKTLEMPGLNPNPTISLALGVLARGLGTIRVYVGGSTSEAIGYAGTPSGTMVGTPAAVSGAGENLYQITGSLANPGGVAHVKVTMQSAAPATSVGVVVLKGMLG